MYTIEKHMLPFFLMAVWPYNQTAYVVYVVIVVSQIIIMNIISRRFLRNTESYQPCCQLILRSHKVRFIRDETQNISICNK